MASLVVEGIKELHLPLENELISLQPNDLVGTGKVVGLDYFFNNEWRVRKDGVRERFHYTWEDTTNSGFSLLGRSIDLLGADRRERRLRLLALQDPRPASAHVGRADGPDDAGDWLDRTAFCVAQQDQDRGYHGEKRKHQIQD